MAPKPTLYKPPTYGPFLVVLVYLFVVVGIPYIFYYAKTEPQIIEKEVVKEVRVPGPTIRERYPVPGPERVIHERVPYFIPVPYTPPPPPPEPEPWSIPPGYEREDVRHPMA